jgi:hypothetical protein
MLKKEVAGVSWIREASGKKVKVSITCCIGKVLTWVEGSKEVDLPRAEVVTTLEMRASP